MPESADVRDAVEALVTQLEAKIADVQAAKPNGGGSNVSTACCTHSCPC